MKPHSAEWRAHDALRLLAQYAAREPFAGLHAQHPGLDRQTDAQVRIAVRRLRGNQRT